ncbi:glycosyltransferase family 2 protein [Erwinia psidii]|uniref:Glycosyltransferase family 2 protein n=1 Tax=Erwinia psidii TaxID=69224 RepID=A0A3N6TWV9_9GAMM|nr:glycosyltransferase family 2 protein [Erwinia psidii]MCX8956418.1 glycosyltransferase family 2 protein [Erwinia psidii]MCX8962264.1 glycosyltransferase family 2 protein [Erwinia psidii]MCX8965809.1 glycosyltransferase family 2 protein [Erwinia psidii]RQM39752.1 glycosyltransferase family 2 protein [Erwinia psidii]
MEKIICDKNWQVPDYQVKLFQEKRHSCCVVIPVINEGERITRLLSRMTAINIASLADIIIIDGGSNDGSLAEEKLINNHVRTLLIKTGPGKLSAQLRCAYAYALEQGYEGIITIDGNDKDDPEAIPRLISALQQGKDFIQGSRFIKGGVSENTPLSRYLAIRWIHAPLLSLASGFRWTDTTQGFRAYSSKMLADPRVAPFRAIFNSYELLAYLSYRAPKLGYQCGELATVRKYPKGEVPTKISSVRGNYAVFKTLLSACLGKYNPKGQ